MKSPNNLIYAVFTVVLILGSIISCSKDNIDINVGNTQGQGTGDSNKNDTTSNGNTNNSNTSDTTSTTKTKLNFDANVYTLYTKASTMSEIEAGRYVTVYPYNTTNTALVANAESYISTIGSLTPATSGSSGLELVTGTYYLYEIGRAHV